MSSERRCGAQIVSRGCTFTCDRPEGHGDAATGFAHAGSGYEPIRLSWLDDAMYARVDHERDERERQRQAQAQAWKGQPLWRKLLGLRPRSVVTP